MVAATRCPHDRSKRARNAALATDDASDVRRCNVQPEDDDVAVVDPLDAHGVGLAHEPAGDPGDELFHRAT